MRGNTFFHGGDIVQLKQDIPNKPNMIVTGIPKSRRTDKETPGILLGVRCFWFTTDSKYQEQLFNTKDLIKVKPVK